MNIIKKYKKALILTISILVIIAIVFFAYNKFNYTEEDLNIEVEYPRESEPYEITLNN